MNQTNQPKPRGKSLNFFPAPHIIYDDEKLRRALTHAERDFLLALSHLTNRYGDTDGWFWHTDNIFVGRDDKEKGFAALGFGRSTCRRVRKRLLELGLIEMKPGTLERGRWAGTMYRLNPRLLKTTGVQNGARSGTIENPGPGPP
ncbi:MAG: hypothetical protein PHU56_01625 [Candidatus Pacebacteria bacterium]|nr:hypothetical protein [Candidatus Paceibacterota bacterium]